MTFTRYQKIVDQADTFCMIHNDWVPHWVYRLVSRWWEHAMRNKTWTSGL
jgi:hypothetical protein